MLDDLLGVGVGVIFFIARACFSFIMVWAFFFLSDIFLIEVSSFIPYSVYLFL